jgi:hypothetical protein
MSTLLIIGSKHGTLVLAFSVVGLLLLFAVVRRTRLSHLHSVRDAIPTRKSLK